VERFPVPPSWREVLARVLVDARRAGAGGVVAFDLDSTLLDNRPRQAAIVRAFARARGLPSLERFDARHLQTGFDMREALARHGLGLEEVERLLIDFRPFWRAHFFTSDACRVDVPVRGAPEYVRRTEEAGAQVVYVTARPESMRPGTLEALFRHGFPLPGERVALWMKADAAATDEGFKRGTHQELGSRGRMVAAFDNEPGHANDYRASFPQATVVLVATGHSGRVQALAEGITAVPHFDTSAEDESPS
jgi:hypothetical protein